MGAMRFFVVIFLTVVLAFLVSQLFALNSQRVNYQEQITKASAEGAVLKEENDSIVQDLEYYQSEENLSKELRAQFNYRGQNEELLILVPAKED